MTSWDLDVLVQFDGLDVGWQKAEGFSHETLELFIDVFLDVFLEDFIFFELFLLFGVVEVPVGDVEAGFDLIDGCGVLFFGFGC